MIPREIIFGNLEYRIPALSPDGKYLAYVGPNHQDGSCCYIFVQEVSKLDSNDAKIVCPDNRIRNFFWAEDSTTILYYVNSSGKPGDETYHLWSINAVDVFKGSTPKSIDLTPGEKVNAKNAIANP
eukprot:CAMPEP_0194150722 /NCGR_PEP_ID=MMETSP0152-20130528/44859_1 /TAXON_ID=1049557 /ORGANISM="Thalassiothrix antarctica, Strain L6-D1" /LENGTH=125 /DNA_ID=CAMNT_0038853923 /DNA_START=168 /DNA_END=541 /DNA_ORIENTATION=-